MWPVMVFFTNSTIHMLAHGAWAQAMMLAGAAELGLVRGKLHEPVLAAVRCRSRSSSPASAFLCTSRTAGSSRARRSSTTCSAGRLLDRRALPARCARFRPRARSSGSAGFALTFVVVAVLPLLRPRRRADLRPPLAARRGAAPVRSAARRRRSLALALPGGGLGARDADDDRRRRTAARVERSPTLVRLHFDQSVDALPNAIRVLRREGHGSSRARRGASADKRTIDAPVSRLPRGGVHGPLARDLRGRPRRLAASSPSASAMRAPPRDRGLRRRRADDERARRPLALLPRARAARRRARLPAARRARAARPRRRSGASTGSLGVGVVGALEVGIVAFLLRAEDALAAAVRRLPLRRPLAARDETRFGYAFVAMTLGFALVAALVFLAWLTDREWLLWPAFVLALGFASGLSLSGHSAADAGLVVALGARRLAAPLARRRSGSAASCSSRSCVWPLEPELRRQRVPALLAPGDRPDRRRCSAAGTYLEHPAAAAPRRPLDERLRAGAAGEARARLARARLGRGAPLPRAPEARARRAARSPACRAA